MFLAKWTKFVNSLSSDLFQNLVHMIISSNELTINPNIIQIIDNEDENDKLLKILLILDEHKTKKVHIFEKKKKNFDEFASRLVKNGLKVDTIRDDKAQFKRERILSLIKYTKMRILVVIDVAARDVDVFDIDLVLNFYFLDDIESCVIEFGKLSLVQRLKNQLDISHQKTRISREN
jgi:superfamily II DNA/RNA helicase